MEDFAADKPNILTNDSDPVRRHKFEEMDSYPFLNGGSLYSEGPSVCGRIQCQRKGRRMGWDACGWEG